MKQKKTIVLLLVAIILTAIVTYLATIKVIKQSSVSEKSKLVFDQKLLEDTVFATIEAELKSRYNDTSWDKKILIQNTNISQKAAKGVWWKKDAWDWIAWQQENGSWKVLASFDGFNCKELDTIPSQYMGYFRNIIYPNFGGDQPDKKYCY